MPAYVICSYDIADPKGYEAYVPGVMPLLQKHGGGRRRRFFGESSRGSPPERPGHTQVRNRRGG